MDEGSENNWLSLCCTPGVGPATVQRLLRFSSLEEVMTQLSAHRKPEALTAVQWQQFLSQGRQRAKQCLSWQSESANRTLLLLPHSSYPPLLKAIDDPPPVLFVEGDVSCLSKPQIAIVGSRNATIDGQQLASEFSAALAKSGLVITSGLALGIDGFAHHGALTQNAQTIAVLGSGLNCIYPNRHRGLAKKIIQTGALVSEFTPDTRPIAGHFPRRNRIISGLSCAVLVVEATQKSGSLITADFALQQGRDVFAIPSSVYNPAGVGTNSLIKQGASLVTRPEEVLDEINPHFYGSMSRPSGKQRVVSQQIDTKEELPFRRLLANVGSRATPVDILAQRTNISVQEVMKQLLELELAGKVVSVSGGYIIKRGRGEQ